MVYRAGRVSFILWLLYLETLGISTSSVAGCGLFCGLDLSLARDCKCNLVGPVVFCYACGVLDFVSDFSDS